jgi:hypothetical protein
MILTKNIKKLGRPRKDLIKIGNYWITEYAIKNYRHRFTVEYVYAIRCSLTGHVVYVGKTCQPEYRKACHFSKRPKSLVGKWCNAMVSIGYVPMFEIIDITYGCSLRMEAQYIRYYSQIGQANFNIKHNYTFTRIA